MAACENGELVAQRIAHEEIVPFALRQHDVGALEILAGEEVLDRHRPYLLDDVVRRWRRLGGRAAG